MSSDLKSFIKSNKNTKNHPKNKINAKTAQSIADSYSKKSSEELNSDFTNMLATAKQNGTFNKSEMLKMLASIKSNMPNGEYERIRAIINNL